jgi:hypothetical protein
MLAILRLVRENSGGPELKGVSKGLYRLLGACLPNKL